MYISLSVVPVKDNNGNYAKEKIIIIEKKKKKKKKKKSYSKIKNEDWNYELKAFI